MSPDDNESTNPHTDPSTIRKKAKRGPFKRFCADTASVVALLKAMFQLFKLFWDFLQH